MQENTSSKKLCSLEKKQLAFYQDLYDIMWEF